MKTISVLLPKVYLIQEPDYPLVTMLNASTTVVRVKRIKFLNNNDYQAAGAVNARWKITATHYTGASFTEAPYRADPLSPFLDLFIVRRAEVNGTATPLRNFMWGWDQIAASAVWSWGIFARMFSQTMYDGYDGSGQTQPWTLRQDEALALRANEFNAATDRCFPTDVLLELAAEE